MEACSLERKTIKVGKMLNELRYTTYRMKYRYGQHLPLKVPVDISLELASSCNMKCSYCYHADKKNLPFAQGLMSKEMAMDIVRQSADLGVNSLKFNYRGEGTLNPHYTWITTYAKSLASGSTFIDRLANSNFKIIPKWREDRFIGLANLTKVKVSYDSFKKSVFEYQRDGGNHDLTTENIDLFYNHPARIKSETQLVIQAVRTTLNKDEDIAGIAKKRWPEAEISIRDMVAGRVEKDVSEFEDKERDFQSRQACKQAFVRIIFTHEGKALPCCPAIKEDLVIGDINSESVSAIFNGKKANQLRKRLKSLEAFDVYDACKNCSSFESFKGYAAPWGS